MWTPIYNKKNENDMKLRSHANLMYDDESQKKNDINEGIKWTPMILIRELCGPQ